MTTARVGGCLLALLGSTALAAPLLAPYDPNARSNTPFARPSAAHLLGTNDVGHDLLSELIYGARISLLIGVVAALAATLIGLTVGVVAGYALGWLDATLMRLVDVVLALPILPLALVVGVFLGPGLSNQILVITLVIWAPVARELRAQVLSLRERDHIQALRAMGGGMSAVAGAFPQRVFDRCVVVVGDPAGCGDRCHGACLRAAGLRLRGSGPAVAA
ncbi:MAG: ABC transporter permease [Pseudonocardiaceae bacterium]